MGHNSLYMQKKKIQPEVIIIIIINLAFCSVQYFMLIIQYKLFCFGCLNILQTQVKTLKAKWIYMFTAF